MCYQVVTTAHDRCAILPWPSENLYECISEHQSEEWKKKVLFCQFYFPFKDFPTGRWLFCILGGDPIVPEGFLCCLVGEEREGGWREGESAWDKACPGSTCAETVAAHADLVTTAIAKCEALEFGHKGCQTLNSWRLSHKSHICGWRWVLYYICLIYMRSAFLLPPAIIGWKDSKWADIFK